MSKVKYPGVRHLGANRYEIRATWKDPGNGKTKDAIRTIEAATVHEAARCRIDLRDELLRKEGRAERWTVRAYVHWWLERRRDGVGSKKALRQGTLLRYAEHLDSFVDELGDLWMDELMPIHVNRWLDKAAERPSKRSKDGKFSGYTLLGMLRTVRTVTADAKAELRLPFWACERVTCPTPLNEYTEEEPNALTPAEADRMWRAMRETEADWFPLFAFMADTGIRFCHAHAFEWGDLDLDAGVYRIGRSRYRGQVNPPSKRKSGHHTWSEMCDHAGVGKLCDGKPEGVQRPGDKIGLAIPTLEGLMMAEEGDWIIRGVKGELYPCKPDIFEATYEAVNE